MYLAFGNPHDPRGASEKHLKLYDRKTIPLPKNFLPLHPFNNGELLVRDEQLAPWPRTEDEVRRHLHDYYAAISGLDEQIGRVLATLKDLKLDENTHRDLLRRSWPGDRQPRPVRQAKPVRAQHESAAGLRRAGRAEWQDRRLRVPARHFPDDM